MPRPRKHPLQLLSTAQTARITGHSTKTVQRWARTGKLRPVDLSRRPMFLEREVERLIKSARRPLGEVA